MPETFRNRECIVLFKGGPIAAEVDSDLAVNGWSGGQVVNWTSDPGDRFVVGRSDGLASGFLMKGSNEMGDRFTAITSNQSYYRIATLCSGGWIFMTSTFERYTWASRQVGPLVEIPYQESDKLRVSLRGLWTTEDEWTLSGDPRAPNNWVYGVVAQAPTAVNDFFMTLQVFL